MIKKFESRRYKSLSNAYYAKATRHFKPTQHIGKPNPILGEIRGIIEKQEPKIIEYFLEYGTLQGFRFDRLGQRTLDKLESILVSVSKLDISVEEMEEKYREKHQNNGRHPRDYDTRYRTAKGFKGRPKSTRSYDNH